MKFKYCIKSMFVAFLLIFCIFLSSCDKKETQTEPEVTAPVETLPEATEPIPTFPTYEDEYHDDGFIARGEGLENAIVVFHYQRENGDYENWNIWVWNSEGIRLKATNQDSFGVYYKIDLGDDTKDYYHSTTLGYIYHKGDWDEKDKVSQDRFVNLTESMLDERNEIHLYSFEGVETMYLDRYKQKPICEIKGFTLSATNSKTVEIDLNTRGKTYTIYNNGNPIVTDKVQAPKFPTTLPEPFSLVNGDFYSVEVDFGDGMILSRDLNYYVYYDSQEFKNNYIYD